MSFGFSPSDIVALVSITSKAYRGWKHACGEYSEITGSLDSLLIVLERIKNEASKPNSVLLRTANDRRDLKDILSNADSTVRELHAIVVRYKSLGTSREKNWDKLRFGIKNLDPLRTKLAQHVAAITAYLEAVGLGALGRIERDLNAIPEQIQRTIDGLAAEMRAGRREGTVMSTYSDDEKDVWKQFRRELIGDGIKSSSVHKYKPLIRKYLRELVERGELEELPPEEILSPFDCATLDEETTTRTYALKVGGATEPEPGFVEAAAERGNQAQQSDYITEHTEYAMEPAIVRKSTPNRHHTPGGSKEGDYIGSSDRALQTVVETVGGSDTASDTGSTEAEDGESDHLSYSGSDDIQPKSTESERPNVIRSTDSWGFWGASLKGKDSQSSTTASVPVRNKTPKAGTEGGLWDITLKERKSQSSTTASVPTMNQRPEADGWGFWGTPLKKKERQSSDRNGNSRDEGSRDYAAAAVLKKRRTIRQHSNALDSANGTASTRQQRTNNVNEVDMDPPTWPIVEAKIRSAPRPTPRPRPNKSQASLHLPLRPSPVASVGEEAEEDPWAAFTPSHKAKKKKNTSFSWDVEPKTELEQEVREAVDILWAAWGSGKKTKKKTSSLSWDIEPKTEPAAEEAEEDPWGAWSTGKKKKKKNASFSWDVEPKTEPVVEGNEEDPWASFTPSKKAKKKNASFSWDVEPKPEPVMEDAEDDLWGAFTSTKKAKKKSTSFSWDVEPKTEPEVEVEVEEAKDDPWGAFTPSKKEKKKKNNNSFSWDVEPKTEPEVEVQEAKEDPWAAWGSVRKAKKKNNNSISWGVETKTEPEVEVEEDDEDPWAVWDSVKKTKKKNNTSISWDVGPKTESVMEEDYDSSDPWSFGWGKRDGKKVKKSTDRSMRTPKENDDIWDPPSMSVKDEMKPKSKFDWGNPVPEHPPPLPAIREEEDSWSSWGKSKKPKPPAWDNEYPLPAPRSTRLSEAAPEEYDSDSWFYWGRPKKTKNTSE